MSFSFRNGFSVSFSWLCVRCVLNWIVYFFSFCCYFFSFRPFIRYILCVCFYFGIHPSNALTLVCQIVNGIATIVQTNTPNCCNTQTTTRIRYTNQYIRCIWIYDNTTTQTLLLICWSVVCIGIGVGRSSFIKSQHCNCITAYTVILVKCVFVNYFKFLVKCFGNKGKKRWGKAKQIALAVKYTNT